jgi:hypothetical protein
MSELSPSQRAKKYRKALTYLDSCGPFNEEKLREANRIAGDTLTEADIQRFVRTAPLIMASGGKKGGMESVREELRKSLVEGIEVFGSLADAGVGRKAGCFGVVAMLAIPALMYFLR